MKRSNTYMTTALALAGALAAASSARAEDSMQVSGTTVVTQVEAHFIPAAGDPAHGFGIDKYVGAVSSPGWFESMQGSFVGGSRADLNLGQSEAKGCLFWTNSDGSLIGSYAVRVAFTMDQRTNLPKGALEGTWEIASGTNRFSSVRGHGTVKGEFSDGNETDHWSGTITGFEKRAPNQ